MTIAATMPPRCPVCGLEIPEGLRPAEEGATPCPRPSCGVELWPGPADRPRIRTFRLVDHSTMGVLPFAFAGRDEGDDPFARLEASGRWARRVYSPDDPDDVERTEYFLPYVRRFLYPSVMPPDPISPAVEPTGEEARPEPTCRHYEFDLGRLGDPDGRGVMLGLRCRDGRKDLTSDDRTLLTKVELIAFSYRVGFLVLRFRCPGEWPTYFDQMGTAAFLRTIAPLYRGFEMPELSTRTSCFQVPQLLAFLLAEFDRKAPIPAAPGLAPTGRPGGVKLIYDDRMMLYTYSCLDLQTCLPDPSRCQALLHRAAVIPFDAEATTLPIGEHVERDDETWLHQRWQAFTKDGGGQVVFNTDRFHEHFLGVYHATYYFDIFLLATLQRVNLLILFERLSDIQRLTTASREGRRLLHRVRRDLLLFKNQCWFSQITNRERGLILWRKWQKVFENQALFGEVTEQSEELDTYLRNRNRDRVEWLVRIGGFLAAAVPAVLGLDAILGELGIVAPGWVRPFRWGLLATLMIATGLFAWHVVYRQRDVL